MAGIATMAIDPARAINRKPPSISVSTIYLCLKDRARSVNPTGRLHPFTSKIVEGPKKNRLFTKNASTFWFKGIGRVSRPSYQWKLMLTAPSRTDPDIAANGK